MEAEVVYTETYPYGITVEYLEEGPDEDDPALD